MVGGPSLKHPPTTSTTTTTESTATARPAMVGARLVHHTNTRENHRTSHRSRCATSFSARCSSTLRAGLGAGQADDNRTSWLS
ncbi:hypothetical protein E2C01_094956 [Portunus trituberculatus]|uniref:Uncharacterized protein n=1 Tax=Portunus trituberculatus TaxID=210409 RepID=A0A5B7JYY8_PORTR|nr:hypothetical protein [Portunus trituberculatus]